MVRSIAPLLLIIYIPKKKNTPPAPYRYIKVNQESKNDGINRMNNLKTNLEI
jgi:hypothetical protein